MRPTRARSNRLSTGGGTILLGAVVATLLLVSACSGTSSTGTSATTGTGGAAGTTGTTSNLGVNQPTDPFYQPPSPLPAGEPGTIIRSEAMPTSPPGSTAYRVLYHSTGMQGQDIAVSGVITVPTNAAPAGGRPVLSWAHPTTGVADACAPSYSSILYEILAGATEFLQAGYVIAATDYEGLGTPGVHPYLVGESEGRSTLDAARAAKNLQQANASSSVAIWGWSQGGQAALFAGQLAPQYAPDLDVVGVAAAAPAGILTSVITADQNTANGVSLGGYALNAYAQVYGPTTPGVDVNAVLTPAGLQALPQILATCNLTQLEQMNALATPLVGKFFVGDPAQGQPWQGLLQQNSPGAVKTPAPILIQQGTADTTVPPATTQQLAKTLCALGDTVQLNMVEGASHSTIAFVSLPTVTAWIADRFAKQPATGNCS